MNIKELLSSLGLDLSEEDAQQIVEAFETAVAEKAASQVRLQVEDAVKKLDEEHAVKFEKVLQAIDEDHTAKLEKLVKTINEDHAAKFARALKHQQKLVTEKAAKFSKKVISEMSSYLDIYVKNAIPQAQLDEAVKNTAARKQLDQIRELLSVSDAVISESAKQAINEARQANSDLVKKLNELSNKNLLLQENLRKTKVALILEEKTKGMPENKRAYLVSLLEDKNEEYIKENFDFVVEMFEDKENESKTQAIQNEKRKSHALQIKKVPTVITESSAGAVSAPANEYLKELKRIDK